MSRVHEELASHGTRRECPHAGRHVQGGTRDEAARRDHAEEPRLREGEHAFLEALETAAESDATWARVLSLVDTEPDSWGGADLARLRAVLIKKKAEETQALAA